MPSFHTYKSSQSQHAVFKITEHFIKNDIKFLNQILVFVDQKSSLQYLKNSTTSRRYVFSVMLFQHQFDSIVMVVK